MDRLLLSMQRMAFVNGHRDKLSFPMWLIIVMCSTDAIPIVNAIAFFVGMIAYLLTHADNKIRFCCKSAWYKNLIKWLTREV